MTLAPWAVVLGLVMLSPALAAGRPSYSATSITTHVVDADTKEPLEEVIVVADWRLEGAGMEGGTNGQLILLETVTDSFGVFHFDAWGPKKAPIGWLGDADPDILLFKPGYKFTLAQNPFRGIPHDMPTGTRSSIYDGKVIEMRRFQGDLKDWAMHLEWAKTLIERATAGHCEWRKIPRLIVALGREREKLNTAGIGVGNYYDSLVGSESYYARMGCGSVHEFVQEHSR
jgi:hypothetical protein